MCSPSYLTETPPRVWVADIRRDAALVAVTWPAVRVAMVTGGTTVALPTSDPRLATAKKNEQLSVNMSCRARSFHLVLHRFYGFMVRVS